MMKIRWGFAALIVTAAAWVLALGCHPKEAEVGRGSSEVAVRITEKGFEPSQILVTKGQNVTLVFTRETEQTCAKELIIAANGKKLDLPLNEPVRVGLGTVNSNVRFACGMDMLTGEVVAQ